MELYDILANEFDLSYLADVFQSQSSMSLGSWKLVVELKQNHTLQKHKITEVAVKNFK